MNKFIIGLIFFFLIISCTKVKQENYKPSTIENTIKINENHPIVIYGDTRNNYKVHKKIINAFMKKSPTIVFNTGDLVYDGTMNELWPNFVKIISPVLKKARYYPVLGNHEREAQNYFNLFNLPGNERWYKINFKNISFYILDSNGDLSSTSKQYEWLVENLDKDKSKYKIFLLHHPLLSVGKHGGNKELLKTIINKYKIDLIFSGHDHAYERFSKDNTIYIVTGGGGAPLYDKIPNSEDEKYLKKYIKQYHYCLLDFKNDRMEISVFDFNNKLLDSFKLP